MHYLRSANRLHKGLVGTADKTLLKVSWTLSAGPVAPFQPPIFHRLADGIGKQRTNAYSPASS